MCRLQADREQFTQLLFEQFNVAGLYIGEQGVLSLYSVGKTTGTVIDLGHGKTGDVVPRSYPPTYAAFALLYRAASALVLWTHKRQRSVLCLSAVVLPATRMP